MAFNPNPYIIFHIRYRKKKFCQAANSEYHVFVGHNITPDWTLDMPGPG